MKRKSLVLLLVVLCVAFSIPAVHAQVAAGGAVVGTVTDPTGAVVPEADITVTSVGKQVKRTTTSNSQGFYDMESLLAASYNVTIKKTGFQTFVAENVKIDAGARVQLNASLAVGTEATQISVQGEALGVERASSESGGVIGSKQIENFQRNGRNFQTLAMLVPGVNNTNGAQEMGGGGLTQGNTISVNGVGTEFRNYLQDGVFNMNTGCQCGVNITSPIDTISEFRIVKDNFSAKYPLSGSANIMVETKSGTNAFHGAAYEYLRNDVFDARNFFDGSTKAPLRQNIFGFTVGGPIKKNKTFFLVGEDWRRRSVGQTLRGAFPDQAIRGGDFTNSGTLGTGALKLDASSVNLENQPHPGVQCVSNSTHLNPACFDPSAAALRNKYWPLTNKPGGGFLNYINNGAEKFPQRDDTYRIDQYFSERFTLMGRVSYETATDTPAAETWNGLVAPTLGQRIKTTGFNALVRFTANISPKTINQTTYAATYDKPRLRVTGATLPSDVSLQLPFKDQNPLVPNVSISSSWQGLGAFSLPVTASDGEGTFSNDFSHVSGSHVIQAGVLYIFGIKRQNFFSNTHGAYSFSGVHSNDPMADYLLGLDASFYQASAQREGYYHYKQLEAYIQDDWKVTKRLTLNLGVREVWYSPDTISNLPWTDFNPTMSQPAIAGGQAAPITGSSLNFIGPSNALYKPTQLDTWSLTVEREMIPRGVLSVAYVGSAAHYLAGSFDYNFPLPVAGPSVNDPGCLQAGQTIPSGGFQFDPCLNASIVSADYTRPFKGWSGISTGGADAAATHYAYSNYNSLQAGWKYSANHLTFTASYTFSKALADVAGRGFQSSGNTGAGAQNARNYHAEYGPV